MGNPSKIFELIRLYPKLSSDPATGKVGEIYYNSTQETLRICINETGPVWANVVVSFAGLGAGTVDYASIRWDSATSKWIENSFILLENNTVHAVDDNLNDSFAAPSFIVRGSNKTAGTGNGGDLVLNAGTSAGGSLGDINFNSRLILPENATVMAADSLALPGDPALDFTIKASLLSGTGKGGSLILNAGESTLGEGGDLLISSGVGGTVNGDIVISAQSGTVVEPGSIRLSGDKVSFDLYRATDPASSAAGDFYYNTGSNAFKFYNGSEWLGFGDFLSDGSVAMNGNIDMGSVLVNFDSDPVLTDGLSSTFNGDFGVYDVSAATYAKIYVDETVYIEDTDGDGVFDNLSLWPEVSSASINYSTGEWEINFSSTPLSGILITARTNIPLVFPVKHRIINLTDPASAQDAATKKYVDDTASVLSESIGSISDLNEVMNEPTGFENRLTSEILIDDNLGDPIFTIQPKAPYTSFDFYVSGNKYTISSPETISSASHSSFPYPGNNYIYFDEAGDLQVSDVFDSTIISQKAFVAIVYWNPDTNTHTYFAEERHGLTMDGETHSYLHTVFGARYIGGLALDSFNLSTGYFESDQGSIRDEDLLHVIARETSIPVLYRQGSNSYWRKKAAGPYPLIYPGSLVGYAGATIPFSDYNSGNWQLTAAQENKFVLMHYFATNDSENPVVGIQGTAEYGSIEEARTAANNEISQLSGLPFAEFVAIGTVVFQTNSGYASPTKGEIKLVNGANYVDFRGTQLYTPAGEATTHSLLSGLSDDDHIQYLLADGSRPVTGNLDMSTFTITTSVLNGSVTIQPNGTGNVNLVGDTVRIGDLNVDAILNTHGTGDLILTTNNAAPTTQGIIRIYEGADQNITVTPHGTGKIVLDGLYWPTVDGAAGEVLTTDGSGNLSWGEGGGGGGDLLADGSVPMTGDLDLGLNNIINVADPVNDQDAATKIYVDAVVAANIPTVDLTSVVLRDGSQSMTGSLDMAAWGIINAYNMSLSLDGITEYGFIDKELGGMLVQSEEALILRASFGNIKLEPSTGQIDVSSSAIKNLLDPTAAQDAATKNYVDGFIIISATAGEALTAGDAVYLDTAGEAYKVDAGDDTAVDFIGVVLDSVLLGEPTRIQTYGEVTISGASFSVGGPVFIDPLSAGGYSSSAPSDAGQWVIQAGTATAADKMTINGAGSATAIKITSEVDPFVYANVASMSTTQVLTNGNSIILATGGVSGIILTLPSPTVGKIFNIKKVDSDVGTITVDTSSGTIDGDTSKVITSQYDSLTITSDGTNFFII